MKVKNLYIEEDVLKDENALKIQKKLRYENKIICKNKPYAKSHLTHLRQTFIEKLNQNYHKLTGFSEPLISSTKNPADKRQIIYFAGNKIFKKKSFFEYIFKK